MIKKVIWAYVILLVFEGAIRKWVLPGLASPLLLVRDPLAIWLIFTVWNKKLFPDNIYLTICMSIGVIGILTTVFFGHGSIPVALYGARPYLVHFPVIFIMGSMLGKEDVESIGKAVLYATILMTAIISLQFYSPQSSWINRGVGGDTEGSGFNGALGFYRPSGTFSFTNGIALFYSLASCFIFYFWLKPGKVNSYLLIFATIGLMVAIPFSISRGLFFSVIVTALFVLFTVTSNAKLLSRIIIASFILIVVVALLSQTSAFQTATEAFSARFRTASNSEGGLEGTLIDRYLGGLLKAFNFDEALPAFGYGLGSLSNVGSMLLSGSIVKGISEGEWGRGIYETGVVLGMGMIFVRMGLSVQMLLRAYKRLTEGDVLPWILLSAFLLNIPQGQWSQATALGFSTVIGGLCIASLNPEKNDLN